MVLPMAEVNLLNEMLATTSEVQPPPSLQPSPSSSAGVSLRRRIAVVAVPRSSPPALRPPYQTVSSSSSGWRRWNRHYKCVAACVRVMCVHEKGEVYGVYRRRGTKVGL